MARAHRFCRRESAPHRTHHPPTHPPTHPPPQPSSVCFAMFAILILKTSLTGDDTHCSQLQSVMPVEQTIPKQGDCEETQDRQGLLASTTITPDYANCLDYGHDCAAGAGAGIIEWARRCCRRLLLFPFQQTCGLDSGGHPQRTINPHSELCVTL